MERYLKYILMISAMALGAIHLLNAQCSYTITVEAGWNFLSIPMRVANGAKNVLFPSAISDAFVFNGNYISKDTLVPGEAYWIKFDRADTLIIEGELIDYAAIHVHAGWNTFGSVSYAVPTSDIVREPSGMTWSDFFVYDNGYQTVNWLSPIYGNWVKVDQDGLLFLTAPSHYCPYSPIVYHSGWVYSTVQICSQCWLRENLNMGTMIDNIHNSANNGTIEKYCFNNDSTNCDKYGGLYQWNEAMQYTATPGVRGICPPSWHIPTMAEFEILRSTVSGDGNKLKATGQGSDSGAGTNTSRFCALLAGYRNNNGAFNYLDVSTLFWSSTEHPWGAYYMGLSSSSSNISLDPYFKEGGFSIRCLKD